MLREAPARMRTSGIGSEVHRAKREQASGFTLIELVVALSIMALALGAVALSMTRIFEIAQYQGTVRFLTSELRAARQDARRSGDERVFQFHPQSREFGRPEGALRAVPDSISVEFVGARSEVTPEGLGQIRFFPDGSSTGGTIRLVRDSGAGVQLRVGWLLGRVSQEPL